ncbi:MAG: beta-galactosidase [Bacteroides sp.]|nr:beta-galactosidase [Roseburia sp.]MCM1347480.1 beta-galactosidase [Bacteroides sp.]MCM1421965.1 beta-galactosidase [Bacteroides sp.]
MKHTILCCLLAISATNIQAQPTFHFGTAINPEGQTILTDSHGLIINGHHAIPVMGELHYSRVPENEWQREIRKMKAGGVTILSTYVFWNHHEQEEGVWNWSGNRNLHRFLELCQQENMPVVLRIGPFCHGEVYQGGFPDWIVEKSLSDPNHYKLRSEAPGFMAATSRLYSNIHAQANDLLWKHGGPVIGLQIENECRGPWSYYMHLKDIAQKAGFDLPFYTRTGWPKLNGGEKDFGMLLPLYGDYADGFWDRKLTDMPGDYSKAFIMKDNRISSVIATETFGTNQDTQSDAKDLQYPYLTCELGGGMMPSYHRRINISGKEILPLAICKLGSGSNLIGYYMYHGGTNPYYDKHSMAECQASTVTNYNDMPHISYDFQAPLGEMGQPNETAFHKSRLLHQFLADWGEELSMYDIDSLSEHYARRGCFEIRNDYVRMLNENGSSSITPKGMIWEGMTFTSESVQPFAKADGRLFFIPVEGKKPNLNINGKIHSLKADKSIRVNGKTITLLSSAKAKTAFVIDGKMYYSRKGGILYKDGNGNIMEESWGKCEELRPTVVQTQNSRTLREVKYGKQKVAEQPENKDFENASVWNIQFDVPPHKNIDNLFMQIHYKGDVARIYADNQLIEDNFWNGKPMWVRLSDLAGKTIELRILPLGKNYPIYLQPEQKALLNAAEGEWLLSLDDIEIIERHDI